MWMINSAIALGTPEEVERAKDILHQSQAQTTTAYSEQAAVGV